jgi:hypothetical protein
MPLVVYYFVTFRAVRKSRDPYYQKPKQLFFTHVFPLDVIVFFSCREDNPLTHFSVYVRVVVEGALLPWEEICIDIVRSLLFTHSNAWKRRSVDS